MCRSPGCGSSDRAIARSSTLSASVLSAPSAGSPVSRFQSCHGVRHKPGLDSQFADDEYVVYTTQQQRLEYLLEVAA